MIIQRIKNFFTLREAAELKRIEEAGYAYAAGILLRRGLEGRMLLKRQVSSAKDFGHYTEFDKGIENAVFDFKKLLNFLF